MIRKAIATVALIAFSASASAMPVQYDFTGTLDGSSLNGTRTSLVSGATVFGSISFEAITPFQQQGMPLDTARFATGTLTYTVANPVEVGGLPVDQLAIGGFTGDPATVINNDVGGTGFDAFSITGSAGNSQTSPGLVFEPIGFTFTLSDSLGDVFGATALDTLDLLPLLVVSDFDSRVLEFRFGPGNGSPIRFAVDSLAAVPLPAAAWLFFSALAGLGFVGRRRRLTSR